MSDPILLGRSPEMFAIRTHAWLGALVGLAVMGALAGPPAARAADHGDAPLVSQDRAADIGDVYFFLDPNDNTHAVLAMDVIGFIVPGENSNMGFFDPTVRFHFRVDQNGDGTGNSSIDVTFTPQTVKTKPQTATIVLPDGSSFTAVSTPSSSTSATPPRRSVTTDPTSGVSFFAGITDDPFFFDVTAEQRFIASVNAGAPNPAVFGRGRDTFAGYNTMMIALDVPVKLLKGRSRSKIIGVSGYTQRHSTQVYPGHAAPGPLSTSGDYVTIDRMGNPAVATVFIPELGDKDEYNHSTLQDDIAGKWAPKIVTEAQKLGMDAAHINVLASVAVTHGDQLRLDTTIPNIGKGGGDNTAAGFPNGRRPKDDVIDTLLTLINNGHTLGDGVDANDVPIRSEFPFFGYAHQPYPPGTIDDMTRN